MQSRVLRNRQGGVEDPPTQMPMKVDYYEQNCLFFRHIRKSQGASLSDVAAATGVRKSTIHRLEQLKDIEARAYVRLILWANDHRPAY